MDASALPATAASTKISVWQSLREDRPLVCAIILCNPILVLHCVNGFLSLLYPNAMHDPIFDTWINPHLDVHAHDGFCRFFTLVMVALQSAVYTGQTLKIESRIG